jgi:hypothetical protein
MDLHGHEAPDPSAPGALRDTCTLLVEMKTFYKVISHRENTSNVMMGQL